MNGKHFYVYHNGIGGFVMEQQGLEFYVSKMCNHEKLVLRIKITALYLGQRITRPLNTK